MVCFIHRNKPLRFCHVTARVGGITASDLWTASEIQEHEVSLQHVQEHLPKLTHEIFDIYAEEQLLFFWTHSVFFRVAYDKRSRPTTSHAEYAGQLRPIIQDKFGNDVGFVYTTFVARSEDRLQGFVALGRRQIVGIPESLAEEICPPVTLALQIERDEYGVSSRVNYADINLKSWMHAEPKVALVALR